MNLNMPIVGGYCGLVGKSTGIYSDRNGTFGDQNSNHGEAKYLTEITLNSGLL